LSVNTWFFSFRSTFHTSKIAADSNNLFAIKIVIHIIVIHPDYQRKGLGSKLLERGLADVDAAGARAYIEASRGGYPLYKRYGFKDVGKISMDLDTFGLDAGIEDMPFLIREPQGVQVTKPIL